VEAFLQIVGSGAYGKLTRTPPNPKLPTHKIYQQQAKEVMQMISDVAAYVDEHGGNEDELDIARQAKESYNEIMFRAPEFAKRAPLNYYDDVEEKYGFNRRTK